MGRLTDGGYLTRRLSAGSSADIDDDELLIERKCAAQECLMNGASGESWSCHQADH